MKMTYLLVLQARLEQSVSAVQPARFLVKQFMKTWYLKNPIRFVLAPRRIHFLIYLWKAMDDLEIWKLPETTFYRFMNPPIWVRLMHVSKMGLLLEPPTPIFSK
jgi:hypothetical protein